MQQTQPKLNVITLDELKRLVKNGNPPVLINALSEDYIKESGGARIPGSHWISHTEIEKKAPLLFPKNREIVTYCANFECTASDKAAQTLLSLGYNNVKVYKGGVKEWKEAGLPFESNEQKGGETGSSSCGCH